LTQPTVLKGIKVSVPDIMDTPIFWRSQSAAASSAATLGMIRGSLSTSEILNGSCVANSIPDGITMISTKPSMPIRQPKDSSTTSGESLTPCLENMAASSNISNSMKRQTPGSNMTETIQSTTTESLFTKIKKRLNNAGRRNHGRRSSGRRKR
jgi:hypothetical protein